MYINNDNKKYNANKKSALKEDSQYSYVNAFP